MFMIIKKKHISVVFIILICVTMGLILNFSCDNNDDKETFYTDAELVNSSELPDMGETITVSASQNNSITKVKNDRDMARSKSCELLVELLENSNVSVQSKQEAEQSLIKASKYMDYENKCESLILSKGLGESAVYVSDDSVIVTLSQNNISDIDAAKINDIIFEQTGNNNIKIVEVR